MTKKAPLEQLVGACLKLRAAREERKQRTVAMQKAATVARSGGPHGPEVIKTVERQYPVIWDISAIANEICDALNRMDKQTLLLYESPSPK